MRAVAVAVHRVVVRHRRIGPGVAVASKVLAADNASVREVGVRRYRPVVGLIIGQQAGAAERGVLIVDAGVDDADAHVLAGNAQRLRPAPRCWRTNERHAGGNRRRFLLDDVDVLHPGQQTKLLNGGGVVHHIGQAVDRLGRPIERRWREPLADQRSEECLLLIEVTGNLRACGAHRRFGCHLTAGCASDVVGRTVDARGGLAGQFNQHCRARCRCRWHNKTADFLCDCTCGEHTTGHQRGGGRQPASGRTRRARVRSNS